MNVELRNALSSLVAANPYRTTDLDAARQHISSLFVPHQLDVVGASQALDVCVSRAQIEGVSLVYHRHGASVRVRADPLRTFFLLQIPICGEASVRLDRHEVHCTTKQAVMISPNLGLDMTFGRGCEQLIVRIDKSELERHLERQLGRDLGSPLSFVPAVPLSAPGAQELAALLHLMSESLLYGEGLCGSVIARKHIVALLLSGILTCLDHNYRSELDRGVHIPRPAYMAKAQEFIENNLNEAIGPDDIAAAAHVSTRALHAGFKAGLNSTPMRYLKQLRLDKVRERIRDLEPGYGSITNIALECGFHHLGHFCAAYKERFGESPRDTLHKKCGRQLISLALPPAERIA